MRRDPKAVVCGTSPPLGILLSVACAGGNFHQGATEGGGAGSDRTALEGYLGELRRYRRPIWLTEFSCGDGAARSPEAQAATLREAVALLESDPDVFRYAWFSGRTEAIPNVNLLGARGELTALGELYVSLPHAERCSP
ncbi:uncharacterized protein SOCE26_017270 [Sorangium cellulosum]|uniref:Asl1-like glycosyl hydrolase catalytic domain-containing protein n=1 Tax=Sorangium cellulosum TaxID=56 RepID=A0A2L0EM05_SORCE|nr:glycosyl hydrolase [Sorangium cellulosum]AUX40327.1 uncharacterized protein SOCE26_017270 [Sorangium cellulosum]